MKIKENEHKANSVRIREQMRLEDRLFRDELNVYFNESHLLEDEELVDLFEKIPCDSQTFSHITREEL